jgi:hypothetical protein
LPNKKAVKSIDFEQSIYNGQICFMLIP